MPEQQVNETRQQADPRQPRRISRSLSHDFQLSVTSISTKRLFLFSMFMLIIGLGLPISLFLWIGLHQPPSSTGRTGASNAQMLQAVAVLSITFLLGFVFGGAPYQLVRIIKKHLSSQLTTLNFRTKYRPSPLLRSTSTSPSIRIRIIEEPLTAQNFSMIISALTQLHTKCWLIAKGRFADVVEYSQTRNARFPEEACLVISKITQNSPVDVKFNVNADASAQGIVEALKLGIDAVTQAPLRQKETQLANQAKELDMKLLALQTQADLDDKAQARHINAQRAELELERQRLEIDRQTVALQKERLEYQIAARDFAFETATLMVEQLYPEVDKSTKAILIRTLLPELLQLGNGKGLELALPNPQNKEGETKED